MAWACWERDAARPPALVPVSRSAGISGCADTYAAAACWGREVAAKERQRQVAAARRLAARPSLALARVARSADTSDTSAAAGTTVAGTPRGICGCMAAFSLLQ